jgi:hypothetical protein
MTEFVRTGLQRPQKPHRVAQIANRGVTPGFIRHPSAHRGNSPNMEGSVANTELTISKITNEALFVLENELTFTSEVNREYDD